MAPSASPPLSPLLTAAASTLIGAFEGVDLDEESGGGMRVVDFGLGTESPSAWSLDVDEMHDLMTVR